MKDFYSIEEKVYVGALVVITLSLVCLIGWASFYLYTELIAGDRKIEDSVPMIYDSDVIQESDLFCPFCGESTTAMNNEVVCRNESCDKYGLPVFIYERSYNNKR